MGTRGPKAKSGRVLQVHNGGRWKKRGVKIDIDHKMPQRPRWLVGEGKKLWEELAPQLHKLGLLTGLQRIPFAISVCQSFADYRECDRQLQKYVDKKKNIVLILKTPNGAIMENPLLHARKRAWEQFIKGCALFGLTPADINNVRAAEKPTTEKEKLKFFKKGG